MTDAGTKKFYIENKIINLAVSAWKRIIFIIVAQLGAVTLCP